MTSSFTFVGIVAVGLLGILFVARRLQGHTVGSDWLVSWSAVYLASLLHLVSQEPEVTGLGLLIASLHPFFLYGGARRLARGAQVPRLLSVAVAVGATLAGLFAAGFEQASAALFASLAVGLGLASAWLLWTCSGLRIRPVRLARAIAAALVPYSLACAAVVALPTFGLHVTSAGLVWLGFGLVVCAGQLALAVFAARERARFLIDSNSRLASLIESSSDFVAWADARGFVRYGNRALRELIGEIEPPDDDDESGVMDSNVALETLHTEKEGLRMRDQVLPIVETTGLWEGETVLRAADGREVPVSAVVIGERSASGDIVAIGLLMRSLSMRLAAERDLRKRYEFERFVSRLAADILGYSLPDAEKAIEHALRTMHQRFEAQRSAIFARHGEHGEFELLCEVGEKDGGAAFVEPSAESSPKLLELLAQGAAVQVSTASAEVAEEVRALGVGSTSAAVMPVRQDNDLLGVLVLEFPGAHEIDLEIVVRPFSELLACAVSRRRAWRLMQERDDELRHAQRLEAVGQLAGGIAHDFNNSLTVISGYAEDLQRTELSEQQRESLGQIAIASRRAASLTAQLLAFSRNQELVPQVFDLNDRLRELQRMLRRVVGEQFNIRMDFDERTPAMICADPVQIDQVVTNLVINARDAMDAGGEVHVSTEVGPANVWLLVSDNGQGMDEETRIRAFEPFFTTKGAGMGTGLGLSTVYGVIKQTGGRVSIDSAPSEGTTVTISLPLVGAASKDDTPPEPLDVRTVAKAVVDGGRRTILLVEDEELVRRLTKRTLEQAGFSVLTADDGLEALETTRQGNAHIDFILSDVVMPRMSGPEFVKKLHEDNRETPVLFMSGYPNHPSQSQSQSQSLSLPEGAVLIEKPFTSSALVSRIGELLDGSAWEVQAGAHKLLAFRGRQ